MDSAVEKLLNQLPTAVPMKIAVVPDSEKVSDTAAHIETALSIKVAQRGMNHIRILSRESLGHIKTEYDLQYSILSEPASRVDVGRMSGATAILIVRGENEGSHGVFNHIALELIDVSTSKVIASTSVYSIKETYEKAAVVIFIIILVLFSITFSVAAKRASVFDIDTYGDYIRKGYEMKNSIPLHKGNTTSTSEVLLRTAKGAGLGMLGGYLIEELIEEIVPGCREFGMLGEILGAITGIGIANRNDMFRLLRDFKSENPDRPLNEIVMNPDFRNWERSHPEEASKLKQILAAG